MAWDQGVTADSPPVRHLPAISGGSDAEASPVETPETPTDPTAQAPSAPVQTAGPSRTVPLETFINERRAWQARAAEHERRAIQLEERLQGFETKLNRGEELTAEQTVQRQQALQALKQLFGADDELKSLLDLAKNSKQLLSASDGVSRLAESQQQASMQRARTHVAALAEKAGLPNDPKFLTRLSRLVAMEAQSLPDADRRFDAGDYSVLDEAFAAVKGDFNLTRREAVASLATTKTATSQLPPGGGTRSLPGPAAKKVYGPGQEREQRADLHELAVARAKELLPGR